MIEFLKDNANDRKIESLWRYPVKGMRGESLSEAYVGFSGIYGDRFYAFHSSRAAQCLPYLTAQEQHRMLLYQPKYRNKDQMLRPPNLQHVEAITPNLTPYYPSDESLALDVYGPSGERYSIHDQCLHVALMTQRHPAQSLTVIRTVRSMTDCRPISLLAIQTIEHLEHCIGQVVDKRRFRANIYVDFAQGAEAFTEESLIGKQIRIGERAILILMHHTKRCSVITVDPATAECSRSILKQLSLDRQGHAGLYAAVLEEGIVRIGDQLVLVS
jgi:MOSC domain-containing protein